MREEVTTATPSPVTPPAARGPRRSFHGGWAMMIAAGLLAAAANLLVLSSGSAETDVLIVDGSVPPGTPAGQVATRVGQLPIEDTAAWGLIGPAERDEMADLVTSGSLRAGDLLRRSDLRAPSPADGAAMSIPIDASRAAGGLLDIGDRVSVIAEVDDEVTIILQSATILDVAVPGTALGAPSGGHSITLQVTEDQAVVLSRAMRTSELDVIRTSRGG